MEYTFNEKMSKPSLHSCDGLIIEVNQEFVDFSGFTKEELLGKSLLDLNTMLRINLQLNLDNSNSHIGYIFTKSLEAREVNIICVHNDKNSMKVYTFIEQQNSRLENKLIFVEQTFIENILGAAVYSAPDLVLLKANQCYLSFMDSPHNKDKKCIGKPFREIVKESPESEIESFLNAILETQKTSHIKEYKINKKASGTTYWDATLTPIFESGKMKYIFVTSVDVTDRVLNKQFMEQQNYTIKKQIKDLETQNKELEAIINNICEEIYIIDKNGNYIITNEAVNKRNSYGNLKQKYDAFNKFDYYDLSGNKLRKKDLPITKLMNGESLINNIMIGYDPHKRFICTNTKPILDVNGNFVMGIMCSRDITNDILYKQSIERHLDMFSNLINNLDLPVIRLSYPDLTIKDINQKKFTILKSLKPEIKSPNDIIGKNYMYIIEGTTYSNAIMNCLNSGIKEKKTSYMKGMKWIVYGQEMFMTTLFQPILGSDGEIEEIIAVSFDVTSEVRINNQMERTLKKQDEFFANISHELKTPLNVIFTTAQLLNMYCNSGSLDEKNDSIKKCINSIKQNSYRLSKLINNIVDLSKIEAGIFELNLSNNNIVEVVEEIVAAVSNFTETDGLNITFDTDTEEKIIACDPEKIERIVLNLISNAIKFSEKANEIFINIYDKNDFIEISVKDSGIGIEANDLNMIFNRFKQVDKSLCRNAEGIGIGLSLVKAITELHEGYVNVASEYGKGSNFTVTLPSKKVVQENMLFSSKIRNKRESIQIELSDISL